MSLSLSCNAVLGSLLQPLTTVNDKKQPKTVNLSVYGLNLNPYTLKPGFGLTAWFPGSKLGHRLGFKGLGFIVLTS